MQHTYFIDPKEQTSEVEIVEEVKSEEQTTEKLLDEYNWDNSQGDLIMF